MVVEGPDKGRRIDFKEGSVSLGRSGDNDCCLADPVLSRRHCRVEFAGGVLKIFDLDSANGTYVNDAEVRDAVLKNGDKIQIGDTVLALSMPSAKTASAPLVDIASSAPLVDIASSVPQASSPAPQAPAADKGAAPGVVVDLGFDKQEGEGGGARGPNWRPLVWGLAAVAVLAVAVSMIMRAPEEDAAAVISKPVEPSLLPLVVDYEKVEAGTNSIFRYHMSLSESGLLAIEIDDLAEDRHVRKDAVVPSNSIARLAKNIDRSGFFRLDDIPSGIAPEGRLDSKDITIVANRRVQHLKVENRVEPSIFEDVREALETFGKNELGIWAIQYPREKLVEMALEAYTHARNLYEERGIAHGNIFEAVKSYKESAFYLETVEPKPDFYADSVSGLAEAEEELARRYEEQRFKADRAINLKDWQTAAEELRILREQIPDDDDPRNADATRKLLDVENRLKKGRK